MGISQAYNKAAQKIIPRWLRNNFMGVVFYSQTLNPYAKFAAGIGCFAFVPFNIPGPVDFLFYLSLVVDGARGSYRDIKGYFNGAHREARRDVSLTALSQLFTPLPENQHILGDDAKRSFAGPAVSVDCGHDKTLTFLSSPHEPRYDQ